jgi:hypothetical protein
MEKGKGSNREIDRRGAAEEVSMPTKKDDPAKKRSVKAPPPSGGSARGVPPNRVLSVLVAADESVKWTYSTTADGVRYVSGYEIVKKKTKTKKARP